METIAQRLKLVRDSTGLKQKDFGATIGVKSLDTISRWERGLGYPSADILAAIHEKYGTNIQWLISGEGPMWTSGEPAKPDERSPPGVRNDGMPPAIPGGRDREFRLSDAITMAVRVLESGTSYATALYLNIQHFDRAIQAEARIQLLEKGIEILGEKIEILEQQVIKLQERADKKNKEDEKADSIQRDCA
jgi:transcriptional regulator with XRE-family HTH domain